MSMVQKFVKRNALKQSKEALKILEQRKRDGQIDKKRADELIKVLKASMADAEKKE
jgi:hypothetical protein